jgi:hypothetical protein
MASRIVSLTMTAAALAGVVLLASAPVAGQTGRGGAARTGSGPAASRSVPRTSDGRIDLQGRWVAPPLRSSNILEDHAGGFGIQAGKSVVVDPPNGIIPYQPWALAQRDRNRRPENNFEDNEGKCLLSGMPRIMLFTFRLQYYPDKVLFLSDYIGASRLIRIGGPHVPNGIRLYMGDSVGRFERDALVVDTTNFNGKFWFALGGDFATDAMHMVERFGMTDANTLTWQATITDPKVFTRPWTMTAGPFTRNTDGQVEEEIEDSCHEGNAELDNLKAIYDRAHAGGKK